MNDFPRNVIVAISKKKKVSFKNLTQTGLLFYKYL